MTTPNDFLHIAYTIQANHGDEVGIRTSINRAYYAAYHAANVVADALLLPESTKTPTGSHQKLYDRLMACDSYRSKNWTTVRNIGYTTAKLKPFRVHADYKLQLAIQPKDAEETLKKAAIILKNHTAILGEIGNT